MRKMGKRRKAELAAKFPLNELEKRIILNTGYGVWSDIAYDAMEGRENSTLSAAHVIELVLDADRLRSRLDKVDLAHPGIKRLFPEKWDTDASDYLWELMREVFPAGRYGL